MNLKSITEYDYGRIIESGRKSRDSYFFEKGENLDNFLAEKINFDDHFNKRSTQTCTNSPESDFYLQNMESLAQDEDFNKSKEEFEKITNNFFSVPNDHTFAKELKTSIKKKKHTSTEAEKFRTPVTKGIFGYAIKKTPNALKTPDSDTEVIRAIKKASANLKRRNKSKSKTRQNSKNSSKKSSFINSRLLNT